MNSLLPRFSVFFVSSCRCPVSSVLSWEQLLLRCSRYTVQIERAGHSRVTVSQLCATPFPASRCCLPFRSHEQPRNTVIAMERSTAMSCQIASHRAGAASLRRASTTAVTMQRHEARRFSSNTECIQENTLSLQQQQQHGLIQVRSCPFSALLARWEFPPSSNGSRSGIRAPYSRQQK